MTECEKCGGRGYIKINDDVVETCECTKKKDLIRRMHEAHIPKRMAKAKLEDWDLKQNAVGEDLSPSQIKCKSYVETVLRTLYDTRDFPFERIKIDDNFYSQTLFTGPEDSGKTFCLSMLCKKAVAKGATVKFYDWFDLTSALDRFDNREELDNLLYNFGHCDLIAINAVAKVDLGTQAKNQLSRLFRKRTNEELWTLVSSSIGNESQIFPGWSDFYNSSLIVKLL